MDFSNAKAGLKKIFSAEILQIIAVPVLLIGSIMSLLVLTSGGVVIGLIGSLLALAGFVIAIVAFIFNIIGVSKASKDEPNYKAALVTLIIAIILSAVSGILGCFSGIPSVITVLVRALVQACEIVITIYVCQGTINVLEAIGGQDALAEKGQKTITLVTGAFILSVILGMTSNIGLLAPTAVQIVYIIIAIIGAVAEIVGYIWYLIFIKKASNVM